MDMVFAAALNDGLSRTEAASIGHAAGTLPKAAQTTRRQGSYRFPPTKSDDGGGIPPVDWDRVLGFYTLERQVQDIATIMPEPT